MACVLMPLASLPGGIDDARGFIDKMIQGGFKAWMMLPVCTLGFSKSPYSPLASNCGEEGLIGVRLLADAGFILKGDIDKVSNPSQVLDRAWEISSSCLLENEQFLDFMYSERDIWEYASFRTLKKAFDEKAYWEWPKEYQRRDRASLERFFQDPVHEKEWQRFIFGQYIFSCQMKDLHQYALSKDFLLIGDIPFYCAADSADVWANPELFQVDEDGQTVCFGGVPSDRKDGIVNWGVPCYKYAEHIHSGFAWWRHRVRKMTDYFDAVRIDHAIGMMRYYSISRDGFAEWKDASDNLKDDARCLFTAITEEARKHDLSVIAEDLGMVPDGLRERITEQGWYCMKIMQYAYSAKYLSKGHHLPRYHTEMHVVFTETHDNETLISYLERLPKEDMKFLSYELRIPMNMPIEEKANAVIHAAYESAATLCIIPVQDILKLGREANMVDHKDWHNSFCWKLNLGNLTESVLLRFRYLSILSGRIDGSDKEYKNALDYFETGKGMDAS